MPEKCRVIICGFDPMLVRGYLKTGERALWWYLPEELYKDYNVKPGERVRGRLLAVYDPTGNRTEVNEPFEWPTSKETGYAVNLPPDVIRKYKLTEFHFLELVIEEIVRADGSRVQVYPGEERVRKWWPDERLKLSYYLKYVE